MNILSKNLFMKQLTKKKRGIIAALCIICALLFTINSCKSSFEDNNDYNNIIGNESIVIAAQVENPYYFYNHDGKKVYLTLNTEYAFLSMNKPQTPAEISKRGVKISEFKSDNSERKQYKNEQKSNRYWAEFSFEENLKDEQYLDLLSDIKRQNSDVIISPYFKIKTDDKIGLSNFFYVKLKEEKDVALLEKMAEQTGSIIIEQDTFMPLWFTLSVTEASKLNALECANFFYESGLFAESEADLMPESFF